MSTTASPAAVPVRMASSPPGTAASIAASRAGLERGGVEPVAGQARAPGRVMARPGGTAGRAVGHRALGPAEHEHRPAAADVPERGSFEGEPRRGLLLLLPRRGRGRAVPAPAQRGRAVPARAGLGLPGQRGRGVRRAARPRRVQPGRGGPAGTGRAVPGARPVLRVSGSHRPSSPARQGGHSPSSGGVPNQAAPHRSHAHWSSGTWSSSARALGVRVNGMGWPGSGVASARTAARKIRASSILGGRPRRMSPPMPARARAVSAGLGHGPGVVIGGGGHRWPSLCRLRR